MPKGLLSGALKL